MQAKIMHGARAQMFVGGKLVGIFTSCTYGVDLDVSPAFILGRFSPAELTITGQEAINITATGWRVIDNGPYVAAAMPKLQDLLLHDDISLSLWDRATQKLIMTVVGVRPTGWSTGLDNKAQQSVTVRFLGLRLSDESGDQDELSDATNLTNS